MRLLLMSDLHCDAVAARKLVEMSQGVDVVVGAGDFANLRRNLKICIEILQEIDKPTVLVAGNNESTDELRSECANWPSVHVLHGTEVTISDVTFFGIGGGIPVTPFGAWSYDFSDEQATKLLSTCPKGCILVSHSPPKGLVDVSSHGKSLGSQAIRDAVIRLEPTLVVCGHIHASAGQHVRFGNSEIVNAGPAGIIWEIDA